MSIVTTGNFPAGLWPGVFKFFGLNYDQHPKEWEDLFEVVSSKKKYEEIILASGFGQAAVKAEGGSITYDNPQQGYTTRATHVVYGLGYIVTREAKEDNQYEEIAMKGASSLARAMNTTINTVAANTYNRAETAGYTGGDGVVLLSTSHPTRSGNQANKATTDADLSEAALEDMSILIMQAKDDRGLQFPLMMNSLHVHPNNWYEANRILKSTLQNDTANNAVNALRVTNAMPGGIKVNHYFDDTDAWFVRTSGTEMKSGMVFFNRRPTEFTQDNDFDTENFKAKSTCRFSVTWGDWRAVYGSMGA